MSDEEQRRQQFAGWFNEQLRQRGWTQGKLVVQSGSGDEERLSSAAVSRYSTAKMIPDIISCQKMARAFGLPLDLILQKAGLIEPAAAETDWVQQVIDDLAHAVDAGQLSEEGRLSIIVQLRREQRLIELERAKPQTGRAKTSTGKISEGE